MRLPGLSHVASDDVIGRSAGATVGRTHQSVDSKEMLIYLFTDVQSYGLLPYGRLLSSLRWYCPFRAMSNTFSRRAIASSDTSVIGQNFWVMSTTGTVTYGSAPPLFLQAILAHFLRQSLRGRWVRLLMPRDPTRPYSCARDAAADPRG